MKNTLRNYLRRQDLYGTHSDHNIGGPGFIMSVLYKDGFTNPLDFLIISDVLRWYSQVPDDGVLNRNSSQFSKTFCSSKRSVMSALKRLEKRGVILRQRIGSTGMLIIPNWSYWKLRLDRELSNTHKSSPEMSHIDK